MKSLALGVLSAGVLAISGAPYAAASKWPLRAPHAGDVPASFDCAMRKAAYAYGKSLISRHGAFESLYYALDLNSEDCHEELNADPNVKPTLRSVDKPVPSDSVYVAVNGDDAKALPMGGRDVNSPFKTIQAAADYVAEYAKKGSSKTIVIREGTHYLTSTISLGAKHSGIHFRGYPGESSPVLSGGVQLKISAWKPYDVTIPDDNTTATHDPDNRNIWVADIGKTGPGTQLPEDIPGLQIDGKRATRARYPNIPGGIETSCGYGCMIDANDADWTPPDFGKFGNVTFYTDNISSHTRENAGWFEHYMVGRHGLCSVYNPPVSYWCSENPSGGGAFAFRTPSGVTPHSDALPHSPYHNVDEAVFFVWRPARWANWMFKIKDYDKNTGNFTFGAGGNQGARGNNLGGDWFVENVMEELDYPGEFFHDKVAGKLYVYYNGTGPPPETSTFVVPQMRTLVNISASQWDPASNITYTGITFMATRTTYMDDHGVPSAGDWALVRNGALFLQGTEGTLIDGCTFDRLDGNAVMVSGYNRNVTVSSSDFSFIGANAVAAWGYTNETATDPGRPNVVNENWPEAGIDGTDGEHPLYTTVTGCTAREVGLYEKQSSFFIQAKTARSLITGNVFFNGPRAGINANDGFGGGDEISHNLVFSTCRESGDHGPFNSWDRQPFLTTVLDGKTPSMDMAWREIHHNFFIDNYSPQEDIDNDDGSRYYHSHSNFLVVSRNDKPY